MRNAMGRAELTARYRAASRRNVEAILERGEIVALGLEQLPHGEREAWIRDDLKTSRSNARELKSIARHPWLSNDRHVDHLPADQKTLYLLSQHGAEQLEAWHAAGRIHSGMTRADMAALKNGETAERVAERTAATARRLAGTGFLPNRRQVGDGRDLLIALPEGSAAAAFFDPQYRDLMEHLDYGNEGAGRGARQSMLPAMDGPTIAEFMGLIERALAPGGHLFQWCDKYMLCEGVASIPAGYELRKVDMVTWRKRAFGQGARTRRVSEHVLVWQKPPVSAKDWADHALRDVWPERVAHNAKGHPHRKPVGLQRRLIAAAVPPGGLVVDPAAGSYSVMAAAQAAGREFLGCDLVDWPDELDKFGAEA